MAARLTAYVAGCALALLLLGACGDGGGGGGGDRPTLSPTVSPTRTVPSPTRTETSPDPTATDDVPTEAPPDEPEPPPEAQTDAPPPEEEAEATDVESQEGAPPWLWWLIAALLVAAVVVTIIVVRARKRGAWQRQFDEASADVAWCARSLLPQLRQAGSVERMSGGWQVASPRLAASDDRLTVLESSARSDDDRLRAHQLRDALRVARGRMDRLSGPGPHDEWALDVDDTIAELEVALRSVRRPH